jgi:signal transduction histidine kinase
LDHLRETTEKIREGDLSVTAEVKGGDEFTLLAESFNSMLGTIHEQMDALALDAERKQMLVDNMAHELRTPLTSIYGYAEYLEKAAVTEEKRVTAAKYIMSESHRLQKISQLLLDEAYIRGNPPEMAEVPLAPLLGDTVEKLTYKAQQKEVSLTFDGDGSTVMGNETLLSMLFYNLTENAVKACREGGTVRLSCKDGTAAVADDGKGMTEEQLTHITEPFYRTDKSRSRAEGGAGLGLALCKRIVTLHGGELQFESAPGKGTRVIVTFTTWKQLGDESEKSVV